MPPHTALESAVFSFRSDGDPDALYRPVRFELTEALNTPYQADIVLATEDEGAAPDDLLGKPAVLELDRSGALRTLPGIVSRVEWLGTVDVHRIVRVRLVPAVSSLAWRTDTRIFQGKTVPEILLAVLKESLDGFTREVRDDTSREYAAREYCVQYDETNLDFCHRLMEEEGITYAFEQEGSSEVMVLIDTDAGYLPLVGWEDEPIALVGPGVTGVEKECLRRFSPSRSLQTDSVTVLDFDWTRPSLQLSSLAESPETQGRESYLGRPELVFSDYAGTAFGGANGVMRAESRLQMHAAKEQVSSGDGVVTAFCPGHVFELTGHADAAFNAKYVLTKVVHHGRADDALPLEGLLGEAAASGRARDSYTNTFECIPADRPYRPELRTRRPRATGVQSAKVVGPGGQELYTDAHGRIKVQFPWDRAGGGDEKSSCFVRVAQSLAGAGWGAVHLPRIGMEVLVQFVEGNPDRPVVTGCVYNGEALTPYPFPDEATRTVLRTNSTPGGGGYNELSFEDRAGEEEVHLRAQHNLRILVKNDKTQDIEGKETLHVFKDRIKKVDANQSLEVGGNDLSSIAGTHGIDVGGSDALSVGGSQAVSVSGSQSVTVGAARTTMVHAADTLTVTGAQMTTVGAAMAINVGAVFMENVAGAMTVNVGALLSEMIVGGKSTQAGGSIDNTTGGNFSISAKGNVAMSSLEGFDIAAKDDHRTSAKNVELAAEEGFLLKVGEASITLKKNGDVEIKGKKLKLDFTSDVVIKGSKISQN